MIKNLFYFKRISKIGGTEVFLWEIVKKYHKDFSITIMFDECDVNQLTRLNQYVDCIAYKKGMKIECERAFLSFNIDCIDDLVCDDIYFVCHAIYRELGYEPPTHPRIKRTIGVSQYATRKFIEHANLPAEACYNPLTLEDVDKPLIFVSAFRMDDETKGGKRVREFSNMLDSYCLKNNRHYLWFIFTNPCKPVESPNVVMVPPRADVRPFLTLADYGISLSNDMETFCYTNWEFWGYGIPVVTTPLSVNKEFNLTENENLVVDWELSNADEIIDKMFNRKTNKFKLTPPEDRWNELLIKGEHKRSEKMKIYLVRANENVLYGGGVSIGEFNGIPKPGDTAKVCEARLDTLATRNNPTGNPLVDIISEIIEEPKKEHKEEIKEEIKVEEKPKKARKSK